MTQWLSRWSVCLTSKEKTKKKKERQEFGRLEKTVEERQRQREGERHMYLFMFESTVLQES